ncbi:GNAT family N-acetyltransferase [Bacillus sp. FJAT-52991]|uniref:GNAT family N-acetyltransferase n=1 Tax=Bacillus kandeliae TaxID=3129297 RepID=A0ABZ2N543_9BACI
MNLCMKEVCADNWKAIALLSVTEEQQPFIESNAYSIAQSMFEHEWKSVGLYDGETLVGYAMYGPKRSTGHIWLDRFMIDQHYQGQGYATRFLQILLKQMTETYESNQIFLSVFAKNKTAQRLYEKFGFRLNGETDTTSKVEGLVMELNLKNRK